MWVSIMLQISDDGAIVADLEALWMSEWMTTKVLCGFVSKSGWPNDVLIQVSF